MGFGQVHRVPTALRDVSLELLTPLPVQSCATSGVLEATPDFRVGNVAIRPPFDGKWVSF